MSTAQTPDMKNAQPEHHLPPGQLTEGIREHQLHFDPRTPNTASAEPTVRHASSAEWWTTFNAVARTPMNANTRAVLVALLSYANGPGHATPLGSARPGASLLMEATGLKERVIWKKLKELRAAGWIVETKTGGGAFATTYRIQIPPTPAPARTPPLHGGAPLPCTGVHPTYSRPAQDTSQSPFAPAEARASKTAKDSEGGNPTYEAVENWAKAVDAGDLGDIEQARADVYESLEATHGTELAEWAEEYFRLSQARARQVLTHENGMRYGAATVTKTLLSVAHSQGVRRVMPPHDSKAAAT